MHAQDFLEPFYYIDIEIEDTEVLKVLSEIHSEVKKNPERHQTYGANPSHFYTADELRMQMNWLDTAEVIKAKTFRVSLRVDSSFQNLRIFSLAPNYNFKASKFYSTGIAWEDLPKYDAEEPIYTLMLSSMKGLVSPMEYNLILEATSSLVLDNLSEHKESNNILISSLEYDEKENFPLFQLFNDHDYSHFVYSELFSNLEFVAHPDESAPRMRMKDIDDVLTHSDTSYDAETGEEIGLLVYSEFVSLDYALKPRVVYETDSALNYSSEISIELENKYLGFRHESGSSGNRIEEVFWIDKEELFSVWGNTLYHGGIEFYRGWCLMRKLKKN